MKDSEVANATSYLSNWEEKNEDELKKELIFILKQQDIDYTPSDENDDTFYRLWFSLNTDLTSSFGFNSIRKLDDRYSTGEKVLNVFSLIFRYLLDEQAKQNPEKAIKMLGTISVSYTHLDVYKRQEKEYAIFAVKLSKSTL